MNQLQIDVLAQILKEKALRTTTYRGKEKPLRIVESPSGIVYLVEWLCPVCKGKGCKACKHKGVMDGLTRVLYEASQVR